jgi:hypothetical protein
MEAGELLEWIGDRSTILYRGGADRMCEAANCPEDSEGDANATRQVENGAHREMVRKRDGP